MAYLYTTPFDSSCIPRRRGSMRNRNTVRSTKLLDVNSKEFHVEIKLETETRAVWNIMENDRWISWNWKITITANRLLIFDEEVSG